MPSNCVCGKHIIIEHTFNCSFGGFPIIEHNELHDITAALLSEVYHNVQTEPPFLYQENSYRTANVEDGTRLDVSTESFGGLNLKSVCMMNEFVRLKGILTLL